MVPRNSSLFLLVVQSMHVVFHCHRHGIVSRMLIFYTWYIFVEVLVCRATGAKLTSFCKPYSTFSPWNGPVWTPCYSIMFLVMDTHATHCQMAKEVTISKSTCHQHAVLISGDSGRLFFKFDMGKFNLFLQKAYCGEWRDSIPRPRTHVLPTGG